LQTAQLVICLQWMNLKGGFNVVLGIEMMMIAFLLFNILTPQLYWTLTLTFHENWVSFVIFVNHAFL
jgi:ABC-type microcin C transport system permease subunit YejE